MGEKRNNIAPKRPHFGFLMNLFCRLGAFRLPVLAIFLATPLAIIFFIFLSFNPKGDIFENRYSKVLLDRNGEILSVFINKSEQWHFKNTHELSPKLITATLSYEDKNFYSHAGFDAAAILRSAARNLRNAKKSGASTITMQTIKLYTRDKRTYPNKLKELIYALRLESRYTKDEILQMYFNNAPYGGNIVGVAAAARFYFGKTTANLSWGEAALLAVLPNAPGLIHPNKNAKTLLKKRNALLEKLHKQGHLSEENLALAIAENLPQIKRHENLAPHLAARFSAKIIKTTLDSRLQATLESTLKGYAANLGALGIPNAAAIIVDTQTAEVLAYAGSQDFYDIQGGGQIDGIIAKRSMGSVLKPLLYALSIDEGLILPDSKLVDAPRFFANFKPQNATKKYYGLIDAKTALTKSLNVPFVGLLQDFGLEKFFFTLKAILGFKDSDPSRYGLSLILGTKEISLEDVAKIYLGLGNLGEFGELCYSRPCDSAQKRRLFSRGAAFLTLEALKNLERVGLDEYIRQNLSWKTGTSYGRKDAVAAGTSPKYTIVAWAGDFSGRQNANLFGRNIAGALLFEIVNALGEDLGAFEKPDDFTQIALDSLSGYRYDEDFVGVEKFMSQQPKNAKPLRHSPFLQNVFVDGNGAPIDSRHGDFARAKKQTRLVLPPDLLAYLKEQNAAPSATKGLKILYPKNNIAVILAKDFEGQNALIARLSNPSGGKVFWYLDKNYLGGDSKTTRILNPESGEHSLFVIDEKGEIDSVNFRVVR